MIYFFNCIFFYFSYFYFYFLIKLFTSPFCFLHFLSPVSPVCIITLCKYICSQIFSASFLCLTSFRSGFSPCHLVFNNPLLPFCVGCGVVYEFLLCFVLFDLQSYSLPVLVPQFQKLPLTSFSLCVAQLTFSVTMSMLIENCCGRYH